MSQDIEQYRPGFEAWARDGKHHEGNYRLDKTVGSTYIYPETRCAWWAWIAAKRESGSRSSTSTSQGALSETEIENMWHEACLKHLDLNDSAIPEFARAIEAEVATRCRAEGGNTCKTCGGSRVDPGGLPICRECGNSSAAPGDALDAARWRWARDEGCNFVWAEIGAGNFRSGLDEAVDARMASSAIATSTSTGEADAG